MTLCVGICDKNVSLDAASGAVPLGVAGRLSRWRRCAVGICELNAAGNLPSN